MPEHKDPAEAVEATAEAIEALVGNDNKGDRKGDRKTGSIADHKIRSLAALCLAGASLLATLGTFLKTCDHSVTESAYNTLAADIVKLSDQQEKFSQDVANMHGFLEGMNHTLYTPAPVPTMMMSPLDAGVTITPTPGRVDWGIAGKASKFQPPVHPPATAATTAATMAPSTAADSQLWSDLGNPDSGIAFNPPVQALAPASPPPAPVKPPAFSDAVK